MMPTKETLETTSPIKDATAAKASISAGHLRADAVSLDVPIKVHGTRVIEAARGAAPQTEPFEETTSTMIVFPQGAVVKMATAVVSGQMVVLTNLKSGHDAICRIVKVRPYAQAHCYVEIEFTHKQPGYWGVYFSSEASGEASSIAKPVAGGNSHAAPAVSVAMKIEKGHDADTEEKFWELAGNTLPKLGTASGTASVPAAPLPPPSVTASAVAPAPISSSAARAGKPESAFVSIGAHEDVQAAASATGAGRVDAFTRRERPAHAGEEHEDLDPPMEISESFTGATEGGHALSQPAHVAPFGRFAAASNLGVAESVQEGATRYLEARKNPHWLPMMVGLTALVVTVIGGALFFYLGPFASAVSAPAATAPAFSPVAANNLARASAVAAASTVAPPAQAALTTDVPVRATALAPAKVTKEPVKEAAQPAEPVQAVAQPAAPVHVKPAAKVPDMFGALNAHPVSPRRGSDFAGTEPAPSVDAMGANGPLQGLPSSIAPTTPLGEALAPSNGGQLKTPQLISSVLPVYPQIAEQAGVEGDVIVQASIDNSGKVTATKALSGPVMLRQAAIDAVRRWKYAPAMLDGKPIATQMTIRIRFHR